MYVQQLVVRGAGQGISTDKERAPGVGRGWGERRKKRLMWRTKRSVYLQRIYGWWIIPLVQSFRFFFGARCDDDRGFQFATFQRNSDRLPNLTTNTSIYLVQCIYVRGTGEYVFYNHRVGRATAAEAAVCVPAVCSSTHTGVDIRGMKLAMWEHQSATSMIWYIGYPSTQVLGPGNLYPTIINTW